jgi:hypothetical protein
MLRATGVEARARQNNSIHPDPEPRGAEDDPERRARRLLPGRYPRELSFDAEIGDTSPSAHLPAKDRNPPMAAIRAVGCVAPVTEFLHR